jgi:hypothetical protein
MPGLIIAVDGKRIPVDVGAREVSVTVDKVRQDPHEIVVDPDGWWLAEAVVKGPAGK